jgi:hypothetical protein
MTVLAWYTLSVSAGRVNLRLTDIPYVTLVAWILTLRPKGSARTDIGQRQLSFPRGPGVSLLPLLVLYSHDFFSPFVSWLRLVQTFSVVARAVRRATRVRSAVPPRRRGLAAAQLARALIFAVIHSDF